MVLQCRMGVAGEVTWFCSVGGGLQVRSHGFAV